MPIPGSGIDRLCPSFRSCQTWKRIDPAARMISSASTTAEKNSALSWPNGWSWSAGREAIVSVQKATTAPATLTTDSSASE
jgi:hypothetical protein